MLWCRRFERLLAAWATGALVAAAVDEASVEAEGDASGLTLHGDWWFNSLRGVPHRYAESAGPIALQPGEAAATRDAGFVALPDAEFILIMACSSWWIHCRRAISEFDRLAEGLRAAGLWKELVAMSLDCSHSANRDICSLVLGDARLAAPVWLEGADAPKIGRLARAFIADLWLADSMPFFYLGSRKEMLYDTRDPDEALNSPDAPRHAIASGHAPSTAEDLWKQVRSSLSSQQDCAQAQKYRLSVHRLKRHDTLCRVEDDSHCYMVQSDLRFSNLPWVPIEVPPHPPVPAATESSRIVVQRIRRAIDLFFLCAVCRERFLAADLEHVKWLTQPRDSVLWLWRVHNAINARPNLE